MSDGCELSDDLRLKFNDHPVCPHCGHVDHDEITLAVDLIGRDA